LLIGVLLLLDRNENYGVKNQIATPAQDTEQKVLSKEILVQVLHFSLPSHHTMPFSSLRSFLLLVKRENPFCHITVIFNRGDVPFYCSLTCRFENEQMLTSYSCYTGEPFFLLLLLCYFIKESDLTPTEKKCLPDSSNVKLVLLTAYCAVQQNLHF
jgi:hypothetical protein